MVKGPNKNYQTKKKSKNLKLKNIKQVLFWLQCLQLSVHNFRGQASGKGLQFQNPSPVL